MMFKTVAEKPEIQPVPESFTSFSRVLRQVVRSTARYSFFIYGYSSLMTLGGLWMTDHTDLITWTHAARFHLLLPLYVGALSSGMFFVNSMPTSGMLTQDRQRTAQIALVCMIPSGCVAMAAALEGQFLVAGIELGLALLCFCFGYFEGGI